jgi:hypothetical protein
MTHNMPEIQEIVREFGCTMTYGTKCVTLKFPRVTVTLDNNFNTDEVEIRTFLVNCWAKHIREALDNEQRQ